MSCLRSQRGDQPPRLVGRGRELGSGCRTLQSHDEVVGADRGPRSAQRLAHAALDPVAVDGTSQRLAPDDEPRATRRLRGGSGDDLDPSALGAAAALEQRVERPDARQAMAPLAAVEARALRRTGGQTDDSRTRPLARRAESTLRPPTVFMRARKPCVRARRIFEGWNVRFMASPKTGGKKALY